MTLASLCLALLVVPQSAPVSLTRKFTANEKLAYNVTSHLTAEQREEGLQTFIPEDFDINYGFTVVTKSLKADGIAVLTYQRPSTTQIQGGTATQAPKSKTTKSNEIYELTVSPVNELIDTKDVTPKKPTKKKGSARWAVREATVQELPMSEFIGEIQRLSLFAGGIDSGLDFAPKLSLVPVKVGDTWQRTVGYQPQKLKGKEGKSAVQRLDYTYTYLGPGKSDSTNKAVEKIQAKLKLDTDLGDFIRSIVADSGDSYSQAEKDIIAKIKMPLRLNATIDFELDPKTRTTLSAVAMSEGGFQYIVKDEALIEQNLKGRTVLELVGRKIVVPGKPTKKGGKP